MNLLKEGMELHAVEKTTLTRKLTIDGLTRVYPVYKVRLDLLYYNDQNDRIATWISQYKAQHDGASPSAADQEAYNAIIEEFIIASNPDAIHKTQNNIEMVDQREPGVVLADGRIIDGNRRFTCLRRLSHKNDRFNYFETVILDRDYEHSAKQIKMLELQIQIGKESRVDYNPIDKLVGIYRDIEESRLLSIAEYAQSTNQKESEVKKQLDLSMLLVEFLEAINAPGQFYIAREMDLNGPLVELQGILKKIKDNDKRQEIKYIVFTNFLMQPSGDMTRFVRNLKKVANSSYIDEFIEKEIDISEEVLDSLPEAGKVNSDVIAKVRANEAVKSELERTMDVVSNKVKATETRNKPNQMLTKAVDSIEAIDKNIIKKLTEEQKEEIKDNLLRLEELLIELKEVIDV